MKKKIFSFLLAICLIIPAMFAMTACGDDPVDPPASMEAWDGTTATVSAPVEGVITIETAEELAGLAAAVNGGETYQGITIELACDMDLKNKEWTPIGCGSSTSDDIIPTYSRVFRGTFDGKNHTIYNLKVTTFNGGSANSELAAGVGLFGHLFEAEVKNLTVDTARVEGHHFVCTAIGYSHKSTIKNITVKNATVIGSYGDSEENGDKVGGVIGYAATASEVEDCSISNSSVKAVRDCAKVIGWLSSTSTNTNATAENVTVAHNSGSAPAGYEKDGRNITDGLYNE